MSIHIYCDTFLWTKDGRHFIVSECVGGEWGSFLRWKQDKQCRSYLICNKQSMRQEEYREINGKTRERERQVGEVMKENE